MTWTKTGDEFPDECWTLSDAAYRLHHEGLSWSNRKLYDCRIPVDDLRRFKTPEAIDELLREGYWRREGDVFVIVHHAGYQRLKVDVLAQSLANSANGRKGGRPRKTQSVSESLSESKSERDRTGQDRLETGRRALEVVPDAGTAWPPVRQVPTAAGES